MKKLTREQYQELEAQVERITTEPEEEGLPGEHLNLMSLLNRFGFNPMSKQEAMQLARQLLNEENNDE